MGWIDAELALTAVAAMLSPTTLSFSILALVLGDRPWRTGVWFYLGALSATLAVGVAAAFVLGNKAAGVDQAQVRADAERAIVSSQQPAAILSAATTRKKAAHP